MAVDLGYSSHPIARWIFTLWILLHIPVTIFQSWSIWKKRSHKFIQVRGIGTHFWSFGLTNALLYVGLVILSSNPPCLLSTSLFEFCLICLCLISLEKRAVIYLMVMSARTAQDVVYKELGINSEAEGRMRSTGFSEKEVRVEKSTCLTCYLGLTDLAYSAVHNNRKQLLDSRAKGISKLKVIGLVIASVIISITIGIYYAVAKEAASVSVWTDVCMTNGFVSARLCIVILATVLVFASIVLIRIRDYDDNFCLRREGRIILTCIGVPCVSAFAVSIAPQAFFAVENMMFYYWILLILLPVEVAIYTQSFLLVKWMDHDTKMQEEEERSKKDESFYSERKVRLKRINSGLVEETDEYFELALKDDRLIIVFERYLVREFSVENMLLYRAAKNLQDKMSQTSVDRNSSTVDFVAKVDRRKKDFCAFYEVFFTTESRLEVNVSAPTKAELLKVYETIQNLEPSPLEWEIRQNEMAEAVEHVRDEIFQLMKKDSFSRFKTTQEFKEWKKRLREEENKKLGYVVEEEARDSLPPCPPSRALSAATESCSV
jgi:hypothetical protein